MAHFFDMLSFLTMRMRDLECAASHYNDILGETTPWFGQGPVKVLAGAQPDSPIALLSLDTYRYATFEESFCQLAISSGYATLTWPCWFGDED